MNKTLIILVSLIVAVSLVVVFLQKNRWYSAADVAKHSSEANCWISVNGNVYDVTKLANTHTGGSEAILKVCGKDGSAIFNRRHGNQTELQTEFENYKIGILH